MKPPFRILFAVVMAPVFARAEPATAPGKTAAVAPAIVQEDRAFLQNIAATETGSVPAAIPPAKAPVRPEPLKQARAKEQAPAAAGGESGARTEAEKPAAAPAPIASKTIEPKSVKRDVPAGSVRVAEARRQAAPTRVSARKAAPPTEPFLEREGPVAYSPAPDRVRGVSRKRATTATSPRYVEVRRAEAVDEDDDDDDEDEDDQRAGGFHRPRSQHGFFGRLFNDND